MDANPSRIYLDYNASTPLAPEVFEAMRPYLDSHHGNPSSVHWAGTTAREAVQRARKQVANLLGCTPEEIVFTSGGSEANNHALKGVFFGRREHSQLHIITTQIEHPAVLEPCRFLEEVGAEVTYLPVDANGRVDPGDVRRALRPETILVSIMHANNEVGTIQPIEAVGEITRENDVLFHTDAAQTVGKIPVDVETLGVDLLSLAGHKLYAPKGVGALYVRDGVRLTPLIHGAGHERGRRAGTENVPSIVGLGAACTLSERHLPADSLRRLRDDFWDRLQQRVGASVVLNGHPEHRLPNTLNVSFLGTDAPSLLSRLEGIAASSGSACHEGDASMSSTLSAMGVSESVGRGSIRFSLGRSTTQAEIADVAKRIGSAMKSA